MKVLIAVDDSEFSKAVVKAAAERIWSEGTEVKVLNVVAIPTEQHWQDWGLSVDSETMTALKKDAQWLVQECASFLKPQIASGATVEGVIGEGHAAECILAMAKEWQADLIMIGCNGRGWLPQFFIGGVAESVILQSPCTVELVRAHSTAPSGAKANLIEPLKPGSEKQTAKVILAIDEFSAERIQAFIKGRDWPAGSEFKVVHVIEPAPPFAVPPSFWGERKTMIALRKNFASKFADTVRGIVKDSVVSAVVPEGDPKQEILRLAHEWHSDLIVLSSRRLTEWERLMLGSVSRAISVHAHCSVVVVNERTPNPKHEPEVQTNTKCLASAFSD